MKKKKSTGLRGKIGRGLKNFLKRSRAGLESYGGRPKRRRSR